MVEVPKPSAQVTPLILTFDEAPNIARTLARLQWADRIVVVDSFSTDGTVELARSFKNVELVQRSFDNHATQWNYGLSIIATDWVLTLDADYILPEVTSLEIQQVVQAPHADGYFSRLRYCISGRPLSRAILPPRIVLFRTEAGRYRQDGHTQTLELRGRTETLQGFIDHDDRKPLRRWLWAQDRYAALEADKLAKIPMRELPLPDQVRKAIVVAPWLVPVYYLIVRGGIWDGWAGLDYAAQRAIAELVLSVKLIENHGGLSRPADATDASAPDKAN